MSATAVLEQIWALEALKEEHDGYQQRLNHVIVRDAYKSSAYIQVSEWQNVSNGCAWTDLLATVPEEHDGYQQRFNHHRKLMHATVHLQEPFLTLRFLVICVRMCSQLWYLQTGSFEAFTTPIEAENFTQPCSIHKVL